MEGGTRATLDVDRVGHGLKVIGVPTRPVPAEVVKVETRRDGTTKALPPQNVGHHKLAAAHGDLAVAGRADAEI
jgi:hypothetical protein